MPETKMVSVGEMVGKVSASSDLRVRHTRVRYLTSTSVGPNSFFRMIMPRVSPNALLDCRGMRMRCSFAIQSTDAAICVDSNLFAPFQRIRILSGSTVLMDVNNLNLLMVSLYNAQQNSSISAYEQAMLGDGNLAARQGWAGGAKEYLFPFVPDRTILRGDHLFDVNGTSDLVVEFYTAAPNVLLYSPAVHTAATYTMSNIELLASYIDSPSLADYFRQTPMSLTLSDWSHRYQVIADSLSQVRLSSSSTSLNGFLALLRAQNVESSIGTQDKQVVTNALTLQSLNLLVNQAYFFDEPIASFEQLMNELQHFLPKAEQATWFSSAFATTRYMTGIRVSAAPSRFADSITSGIKTAALNNEIVLQLTFGSAPAAQRCDTFLQSDVILWRDPSTKDLQIRL